MKNIIRINTITEVHDFFGFPKPKHPLISVIRFTNELEKIAFEKIKYSLGLYQISLKGNCPYTIANYGRNSYDFQEGTMVFTAPEQVLEFQKNDNSTTNNGWSIVFHPDLIRKSELGKKIDQYTFFSYATNEALHLSEEEQNTVSDIAKKIEKEYNTNIDAHSQTLLISNLELLLNYCTRFYDRQFFTRTNINKDIVVQFQNTLKEYYNSNIFLENGVPTVSYCANELHLSPKYLSDLLRKETGKNTLDHIHHFVIDKAKSQLLNSKKSVSEIAYELGFEYPQYFSRMFKKRTKMSPSEFRNLN